MNPLEMLEPLLSPLAAVQRLIEQLDNQGVIIGGVAASLLGQPRLTADADALFLLSVEEGAYKTWGRVDRGREKV